MICCSMKCPKRKQCGRWAPISADLYPNGGTVEPLDEFGSGHCYVDKEGKPHFEEKMWCGEAGNYGEFVQAKHPCPENVDYVYEPKTGKLFEVNTEDLL